MTDERLNQSYGYVTTYSNACSVGITNATADDIVESPKVNGSIGPLADFGYINFTTMDYETALDTSPGTTYGPYGFFNTGTVYTITMSGGSGQSAYVSSYNQSSNSMTDTWSAFG